MPLQTFFMCPPTFFQIEFTLNKWTNLNARIDPPKAQAQWQTLWDTYHMLGVELHAVNPEARIPELTFVGDSIFLYGEKAVASHFQFEERMAEVPATNRWFENHGFEIATLPPGVHYEGNGDSFLWRGMLLGGYGIRSDREAYPFLADILGLETVPLQLLDPFYHLDLALCPIDDDTLAYFPGAFSEEAQATLRKLAPQLVAFDDFEVMAFAGNTKVVGDTAVANGNAYPKFVELLTGLGMRVIQVDTSEFNKAGGGAKCLTLEHYRPTAHF